MRLATGLVVIGFVCSSVFAADPGQRTLTFDDRVRAQTAIEQVYWTHREWPIANPGPKPSLSAVMPDDAIRAKVDNYLRESNAIEMNWKQPITPKQLQAEMNRMAADTRDAALLRELFAALSDDPYLIAETLARQTLADRLIRNRYAFDDRFHGELRAQAEEARLNCGKADCMKSMGGDYHETVWKLRTNDAFVSRNDPGNNAVYLDINAWETQTEQLASRLGGTPDALRIGKPGALNEAREGFSTTAVLAQASGEVVTAEVAWHKTPFDSWWPATKSTVEARVDVAGDAFVRPSVTTNACTTESWTPIATGTAPDGRQMHTAVWTGTEMIVWGGIGNDDSGGLNSGDRYNPATDTWTAAAIVNAPAARVSHTAVWTGTTMIVWGGQVVGGAPLNSGGRYDPTTDTWAPDGTGSAGISARSAHSAVWTGTEMIIWGGSSTNDGARYNPDSNSWNPVAVANAPLARVGHTAIWSGSEMIVWGGYNESGIGPAYPNTGGRYNPTSNTWTATSTSAGVPVGREAHSAVWTGTKMIVWGGAVISQQFATGGVFNPLTNSWTATSTGPNVPIGRYAQTAVWTGTEMIVWGGYNPNIGGLNTGGRYDPSSNSWKTTSTGANVPSARANHTAIWTGTAMIVWAGNADGGARYDPVAPILCNDEDPCTDDTCDPVTGCVHTSNTGSCDDGNVCTANDTCGRRIFSTESFDEVTAPDLPVGWTSSVAGTGSPWVTRASGSDTVPNSAYGVDSDHTADDVLDSPGIAITSTTAKLTFRNRWSFDEASNCYDAGVLEIKIGAGPFADIVAAGGSFASGGYTGTVDLYFGNSLAGRAAWCHDSDGYPNYLDTVVNLPASAAGETIKLRWRIGSDSSASAVGQDIDSIEITDSTNTCQGGPALDCDDNNPCTDDSCGPASGCVHANNTRPCDDGNPCSPTDTCQSGACVGADPKPIRTWYRDMDGDGYGDSTLSQVSCTQPAGHVELIGDCDDADATIYPGAPEWNDGRDNECPGEVGFGEIDEISGVSGFTDPNNRNRFCWVPQSGAGNYQVVRSTQPNFSPDCPTATIADTCLLDPAVPIEDQGYFYLVRALAPHVGSWGQDSSGREIVLPCVP